MKSRESNFELLRIITILMIIFYHFLYHTHFYYEAPYSIQIVIRFIVGFLIMHVNIFILLSGYFSYKNKFKISKLLSLNNAIWFYVVLFFFIGILFFNITYTKLDILKAILPITFNDYWFMTNFLLLYILSPILNKFINNTNRQSHFYILVFLLVVFSILPTFTNGEFYNVSSGYSLYHFIFMYLIGAYLAKYNIKYKIKYLIIAFIIFYLLNTTSFFLGSNIVNSSNSLLNYLGKALRDSYLSYNSPFIIFQAITFLLIFKNIKISSKVINYIASNVLGIYLIHDNNIVRTVLLNNITINFNSYSTILLGLLFTIIIFIICLLIEILRKLLFKFIYNLKISKYLRPKYTKYFTKVEKYIN